MATEPGGLPQDMAAAVTLAGVRRKGVPDGGLCNVKDLRAGSDLQCVISPTIARSQSKPQDTNLPCATPRPATQPLAHTLA